jgi:NaMN:DMB phosphoribosyltransferase
VALGIVDAAVSLQAAMATFAEASVDHGTLAGATTN